MAGIAIEVDPGSGFSLLTLGARFTAPRCTVAATTLAAIAEGLGSSLAIEPLAFGPDDGRRYARLLATAAYEAWLIAWPPGSDLGLHDHGGSEGVFHIVEGALLEVRTDLKTGSPLQSVGLAAGATHRVAATTVHRVWNPGPAPARSVHVYAPPLTSMTFFDDREGSFLAPLRTEQVADAPDGDPR